jgi:hypothetical protein
VVFKTISAGIPERKSFFQIQNPKSKIQN